MTTTTLEKDPQNQPPEDPSRIDASPAKRFFVEMLTRDIELSDAILDLLDNCVDGAIRTKPKAGSPTNKPYQGYFAKIKLSPTEFSIEDNCGGISHEIAQKHALRLGREDSDRDANLATVGVYGIGMKRAIFKLGSDAKIHSYHPDGAFLIPITSEWMEKDIWHLKMEAADNLAEFGTKITVRKLKNSIALLFDKTVNDFINDFKELLRKHYSYIIEKGFTVEVNGEKIIPKIQKLLLVPDSVKENQKISPYFYELTVDGVSVELVMGLYDNLPSEDDVEEGVSGRRSKSDAGWTVICNDRIVIDNDKTHLTGWGENGLPNYHSQFIAITGVVTFTSNDPKKLPVKTTKRGIDQDSALYSVVKNEMREALRVFTSFTNQWKSDSQERREIHEKAESVEIKKITASIPAEKWRNVTKGGKGRRYVPDLPKNTKDKANAKISFAKPIADVEKLRSYFGEDTETKASEIGSMAFDVVLKRAG